MVIYLNFEVSRFSLFVWIVLVVIFPTKLDSPHSEFVCKSYHSSCFGVSAFSAQAGTTGPRPVLPLDSKPVVPRPPGSFQNLVLVSGGAFSPALPGPPGTTAAQLKQVTPVGAED